MKMTFRWFGTGHDRIPLKYIQQIPAVKGVITTLYDKQPGESWERERIQALKKEAAQYNLEISGIESVNIHDSIKIGQPQRDRYIENYIQTLKMLGEEGIDLVCYNFMAVFDWTRSDLAKLRSDGATVLSYDKDLIDDDAHSMLKKMEESSEGFLLPGWEPERMARLKELFEEYAPVDEETLFSNLKYFLEAIMPTCEKYGIRMAIHPDDPGWSVFGLPRIMKNGRDLKRLVDMVPSECNGISLCTGSLGSSPDNDIPAIIHSLKGRIPFAHVRNLIHHAPGKFDECSHWSADGSMDMYAIMKALYDTGFDGIIRPDHGRAIWDEEAMPGYGLYDRALGIAYLNGLWEALSKQ